MNLITRPTAVILLILTTLTAATSAQQKRQTPAKPQPKPAVAPSPPPTFDTLIPAESYTIYVEMRSVGHLIRSNGLNDILEPVLKLGGPPKEFRSIVKWLNAHADELMTSRLLVATWPTAKEVPETIVAVEFASAEEAAKFATPLNEFLPTVLPAPTPDKSPEAGKKTTAPAEPSFHLQQAGSLILLTPKPLKLANLRGAASKPLADDNSFRAARSRFSSEPLFVFIDLKSAQRQQEERQKQYQDAQRVEAERIKREVAAAEAAKQTETPPVPELNEQEKPAIEGEARVEPRLVVSTLEPKKEPPAPDPISTAISMVGSSLFNVESDWPDAVGLALSFENESFDLRALLVSQPGEKGDAVPFMPMLIPGPAILPESPNLLPADTELFVSMSLDLPQIYATLSRPRPNQLAYTSRGNVQTGNEVVFQPSFAAIEKLLKINIKDELLPLLGSEVAVGLPLTGLGVMLLPGAPAVAIDPKPNSTDQNATARSSPVVLVSLRDQEGMRALMPKLIEGFGFKGATAFAQTERRDDTELVSYANLFAYAFIGNFLVLSGDAATTRHVVDSYLKRETLSGDSNFRTYTRWQPRPSHGQIYVSPSLMESYKELIEQPSTRVSDQTRALLTRLTAVAQPITYSLSNEGFGPLHELHLPRNLVLMAITGISGEINPPAELRNERVTMGLLFMIAHGQEQHRQNKGNGSYGTLEQLIAEGMVSKEMIESCGYRIDVMSSGDKFEVSAVPIEYGKTGRMSYFIDQTRVLRGADRAGASANRSDPPVN